jgi:hypothetical protein
MPGMEESIGIAEVVGVKRLPLMGEINGLEEHIYAIHGKDPSASGQIFQRPVPREDF